jgi:hypothetical protein
VRPLQVIVGAALLGSAVVVAKSTRELNAKREADTAAALQELPDDLRGRIAHVLSIARPSDVEQLRKIATDLAAIGFATSSKRVAMIADELQAVAKGKRI